jgi:hypothetical protein
MTQHVELVEIVEDSNHNVAARDCHLSIKNEHAIRWINKTSNTYTIDFEESPLEADISINVPAGSKRKPGESATLKLKAGVEAKKYHYDIRPPAASSAHAADPIVIVHLE